MKHQKKMRVLAYCCTGSKDLIIEIENVKKDLGTDIESVEKDLKIWFDGMLVASFTALSGMMTLIVHLGR